MVILVIKILERYNKTTHSYKLKIHVNFETGQKHIPEAIKHWREFGLILSVYDYYFKWDRKVNE